MKLLRNNYFLCFLSALFGILSFPVAFFSHELFHTVAVEFFAFFFLLPFFRVIKNQSPRRSFTYGIIMGMFLYTGTLFWITIAMNYFGGLTLLVSFSLMLLLCFYVALYVGVFAYSIRSLEKKLNVPCYYFAPFVWTILEYARTYVITGFPWCNIAYSQYLNLGFIQILDAVGIYGIVFVIILINSTLYMFIDISFIQKQKLNRFQKSYLVAAFIIVCSFYSYGYQKLSHPITGQKLDIAVVQGNIAQDIKWDEADARRIINIHKNLTYKALEKKRYDLIIWPETALPWTLASDETHMPDWMHIEKSFSTPLLAGALTRDKKSNYEKLNNSALLFSPEFMIIERYSKVHLVPFGEYVPLTAYLELGTLVAQSGAFSSGEGFNLISLGDKKFGTFICFESIFPDIGRAFKKNGADFLVELTNDAWFERTSALYQHLSMAVFRAVEMRLPLVRSTNTGISAFINRNGKIESAPEAFTAVALDGSIMLQKTETIYERYGDWFFWLQCFVFVTLIIYLIIKRKYAIQ